MKRFHVVFVVLVAICAFGVLTAESASALTFLLALWLVNGAAVAAQLNVTAEGELLLEDIKGGLFLEDAAILCSGFLDGTVSTESLGVSSEALSLGGVAAGEPLVGPGITCSNELNCPEPSKAWAHNLPWDTEVELVEDEGTFFAILILPHAGGGEPGWETECFGIEDLCLSPEGVAQLLLDATGTILESEFSNAFRILTGVAAATCTRGGVGSGIVESDVEGAILLVGSAEALSVSSESIEA